MGAHGNVGRLFAIGVICCLVVWAIDTLWFVALVFAIFAVVDFIVRKLS